MHWKHSLMILGLLLVAAPALAGDHGTKGSKGDCVRTGIYCPHCAAPCLPAVKQGTETKSCWEVETKQICIPRVTFPWETCYGGGGIFGSKGHHGKGGNGKGCSGNGGQDCVAPKCGRSRCVAVLLKCEYQCSVCEYTFEVSKGGAADKGQVPTEATRNNNDVPPPPPVEAGMRHRRTAPVFLYHPMHRTPVNPVSESTTDSFTKFLLK